MLRKGDSRTLAPGAYGRVDARGALLVLSAGTYFFDSLTLATGSTLRISGGGTVRIFIRNDFQFDGSLDLAPSTRLEVTTVNGDVVLDQPFSAELIASSGTVRVNASFTGQIFAEDISVQSRVTVTCAD